MTSGSGSSMAMAKHYSCTSQAGRRPFPADFARKFPSDCNFRATRSQCAWGVFSPTFLQNVRFSREKSKNPIWAAHRPAEYAACKRRLPRPEF